MGSFRRCLPVLLVGWLAACSGGGSGGSREQPEGRLVLVTLLPVDPKGVADGWLDFGTVSPGESRYLELTLRNEGTAPVELSAPPVDEPFGVEPPEAGALDPGEQATLSFRYTAGDSEGSVRALVELAGKSLALTGHSGPCLFDLSVRALDFGSAPPGISSRKAFVIRNYGEAACVLSGWRFAGSPDFSLQNEVKWVLGPGLEAEVPVFFRGQEPGTAESILSFEVSGTKVEIALKGEARAGCLELQGGPLVHEAPAACGATFASAVLQNVCSATLVVASVSMDSEDGAFATWQQSDLLPTGTRMWIDYLFYPPEPGQFQANLKGFAENGTEILSVPLEGLGLSSHTEQTDSWRALPRDPLDVLLLVDDTPAMESFDKNLAAFVEELSVSLAGHDFRLAVARTHGQSASTNSCTGKSTDWLVSDDEGPTVLLPTTPSWKSVLENRLHSLPRCESRSRGLETLVGIVDDRSVGFFREHAYRWYLLIAASEDASSQSTSFYASKIRGDYLAEMWSGPGPCVEGGSRWADFGERVFARRSSICRSPWHSVSPGPQGPPSRVFNLTLPAADVDGDGVVDDGDLSVSIDGTLLPSWDDEGRLQWRYDRQRQQLILEMPIAPRSGELISTTYQVLCGR